MSKPESETSPDQNDRSEPTLFNAEPAPPSTSKKLVNRDVVPRSDLAAFKTIRIAVSGDIQLDKLETAIVDTPDFQRLRRIKQLGTTNLVYPTALHTRFDHSLGTLGMASNMIRHIRENKHNSEEERDIPLEDEQLIRLVALLHDVTHIPFGHTLEDESSVFDRHDKNRTRIERYLGESSPIGKIIIEQMDKDFYERFMKIYTVPKDRAEDLREDLYIYDLVNNTVCADLLEYLRRDCYFCNLVLDMEYRFMRHLYLRKDGRVRRVVIRLWKKGKPRARPDILSELVRLLDNRYLLAERVYFHHAKLVSGAMLADAVLREKLAGNLKEEELWEMGDDVLLDKLQNSKVEAVKKLAFAVSNRNLWKDIYERSRKRVEAEQSELRDTSVMELTLEYWWKNAQRRKNDEDEIAKLHGMEEGDVILYCPDSKMNMKLAEMKVLWNGELRALKDCTDDPIVAQKLKTILDSHQNLWAIHAFLNPVQGKRESAIADACEYYLSFDSQAKPQRTRQFYQRVVEEMADSKHYGDNLPHREFQRYVEIAVDRLCSETRGGRDISTIERVVKNAFTQEK